MTEPPSEKVARDDLPAPSPPVASSGKWRRWIPVAIIATGGLLGGVYVLVVASRSGNDGLEPLRAINIEQASPRLRASLEAAIEEVSRAPRDAAGWGCLGIFLSEYEFVDESNACLAQAAQLAPEDPLWPYLRAQNLMKSDRETAQACLQESIRRDSGLAMPRVILAKLLIEQQQLEEAGEQLSEALRLEPQSALAQQEMAKLAFLRGDFKQAARWAHQSLRQVPDNRRLHEMLVRIYHRLDDRSLVERHERMVGALPSVRFIWPDSMRDRAQQLIKEREWYVENAYQGLRQADKAQSIRIFERELSHLPDNNGISVNLAWYLAEIGELQAAEQVLQKALARQPDAAELLFTSGIIQQKLGKTSEAVQQFDKAIQHKSDYAEAYLHRATALSKLGQKSEALKSLRSAVRYQPAYAEAHLALGKGLLEASQYEDAEKHLQIAVDLLPDTDPNLKSARQSLAKAKQKKK